MDKPIVSGLFVQTDGGARLLGSRCSVCDTYYFPRSATCNNPGCSGRATEDVAFGSQGKIYSYTIQYFPPPAPFKYNDPFSPYAVALVELPEGLRVVGMVSTDNPESLKVGMAVDLVIEPAYTDPEGNRLLTWKFKPSDRLQSGAGQEERDR